MVELIKKINKSGLSPNQYILLYSLKSGINVENFDIDSEIEILKKMGKITNSGEIKDDLFSLELEEKALETHARRIQQIFPPVILGTGIPARGKLHQIKIKLRAFLENYNYDWDLIYAGCKKYVARYKEKKWLFMQNLSTFILDANGDSSLALECDTIEHNHEKDDVL